jgi:hypothetical protein
MAWDRARTKLLLFAMLVFGMGVGAGAVVTAVIAAKASRGYLYAARLVFRNEQSRLLSQAWRAGDYDEALVHAGCEVESEFGDAAAKAFDPERNPWSLFGFAFLETLVIRPNKPTAEKVRSVSEAAARSKLAVVWERLGRPDAAAREYAVAGQLTGKNDASRWRSLGEQTVDAWSKAEEEIARERAAQETPQRTQ